VLQLWPNERGAVSLTEPFKQQLCRVIRASDPWEALEASAMLAGRECCVCGAHTHTHRRGHCVLSIFLMSKIHPAKPFCVPGSRGC
jgi:hypothetical protein